MSTVPALFHGLVDDAALFPPGNAPIERAVIEHRQHKSAPYADLVGRFLCRDSRVSEWLAALGSDDRTTLGLIADRGAPAAAEAVVALRRASTSRVTVETVDVPLEPGGDLRAGVRAAAGALDGVRTFIEIPLAPAWRDAVAECSARGVGAKLRTGGPSADAFPDPHDVAAFISACVATKTPFKCTAGLHRAVCHTDPATGFHHHGFLNILIATHAAITGGDVFTALTAREPGDLAAVCWGIDDASARTVRAAFVGFGSCSIAEPLEDLVALGLLDTALAGGRA